MKPWGRRAWMIVGCLWLLLTLLLHAGREWIDNHSDLTDQGVAAMRWTVIIATSILWVALAALAGRHDKQEG